MYLVSANNVVYIIYSSVHQSPYRLEAEQTAQNPFMFNCVASDHYLIDRWVKCPCPFDTQLVMPILSALIDTQYEPFEEHTFPSSANIQKSDCCR